LNLARYKRELAVFAAYIVLLVALLLARPDIFRVQFLDIWVSAAPVLVVAVGMTLIILTRQIDISVGSQFSVCAVLAALAAKQGVPMMGVALIVIAAGAAYGAFNAVFIALLRLPAIVVTLATMVIGREALAWARQGEAVRDLPDTFQWFGLSQAGGQAALIVVPGIVFLIAVWATRFLAAGRAPYAVGSDVEAARLAGVRPTRVVFWVFVLTGALAGLAAMLEAVRSPQIATNLGANLELKVIAAVVVGGASLNGGRGTLLGTLIGVALLVTIRPALSLVGGSLGLKNPDNWEKAAQGAIILLAVGSEILFRPRTHAATLDTAAAGGPA
jgi:rhamnose transport system permease protein